MKTYRASELAAESQREILHQAACRQAAAEGMVLLENNGILPLDLKNRPVALFGTGARHTVRGGTGSGEVNVRHTVTVEEGLKNAGAVITTESWLNRYDRAAASDMKAFYDDLASKADGNPMRVIWGMSGFRYPTSIPEESGDFEGNPADTAIYVFSRNSGEGADRKAEEGDYLPLEEEKALLKRICESFKHVIVLLNVGGVVDTAFFRDQPGVEAVLLMSQPGVAAGDAAADIISGKVTPSGHLTTTWAASYRDYPNADKFSYLSGDTDDEYYNEGIYVGYRWFDAFGKTPAYPFGYGKTYTNFRLEAGAPEEDGGKLKFKVLVENIGDKYSGRAVVQLYVSAPQGKIEKPEKELKAFGKTRELKCGESEVLELCLEPETLCSWDDERAAWVMEAGDYIVRVGEDAAHTVPCAVLRLSGDAVCECLSHRLALDCEMEMLHPEGKPESGPIAESELPVFSLDGIMKSAAANKADTAVQGAKAAKASGTNAGAALTLDDVRSGKCTAEELCEELTRAELARLCLGIARDGVDEPTMIGASAVGCPGAAGETTASLSESRKIPNLILADGPAGLRLSTCFMVDRDGNMIYEERAFGKEYEAVLPKREAPEAEGSRVLYQYCSAIPVATMLAQTWNMDTIRECGDLVGAEMEEFGVTLWLAPGMNIHRNPLCGRNFEYFSEDPLLSGLCAAAMTEGVQAHPGIGTTIKHFACNNQEDNRSFSNSHVTERALREIYLKGFEIAVKKSQPLSIMTSYNLLNGTHSANSKELLTDIARNEWGFQGVVMTDWGTTNRPWPGHDPKYPSSSPVLCILAGNDLIMPGSKSDLETLENSSEEELPIEALRACAARVVKLAAVNPFA